VLSKLKPVAINQQNRDTCLPKTRLDIIKSIVEWIADGSSNQQGVLWLYGLAGSGKSMLATTITWMMRELRHLGAFFSSTPIYRKETLPQ
jgi:DNA replication protein DnaC